MALFQYCSHVIFDMGASDILMSRYAHDAATSLADTQIVWGLFPGKRRYQVTVYPATTSTDSWATTGNQTKQYDAARLTFNASLRAGQAQLDGVIEMADVLESGRDSGYWKVTDSPPYTAEGWHCNPAGYTLIQNSGVLRPEQFSWSGRGL
jgi:hypothetical protein